MPVSEEDLLRSLARQSTHIQRQLQLLLDAQSEGLLRGLGREPASQSLETQLSSTGRTGPESVSTSHYRADPSVQSPSPFSVRSGSTPTRTKPRAGNPIPVRQPPPPAPPSLKEARAGISTALRSLASVKSSETSVHASIAQSFADSISQLNEYQAQRDSLTLKLAELEDPGRKVLQENVRLREQEVELEGEIRALEDQLAEMKARLWGIKNEREERESNHAADLSSWRNALGELDERVRVEVLADRSMYAGKSGKRKVNGRGSAKEGVWTLPEGRRTVQLVKEDVEAEEKMAEERRREAATESQACEEGAQIWEKCVKKLGTLERSLAKEIKKLRNSRPESRASVPSALSPDGASTATSPDVVGAEDNAARGMRSVLALMDDTVRHLSEELAKADERGWNLLSCCIGAELEALREGRELLGSTLVQSQILAPGEGYMQEQLKPRSEGSGLTASMYTANDSAGAKSQVLRGETDLDLEGEHRELDPEKLFGGHDHEKSLEGPDFLLSHG